MDRKFKIIGIYLGLLFFVVILLVLVTSFSNTELDPSYDVEDNEYQVTFDRTMEESVNSLTDNNEKLRGEVADLNKKISEKEQEISKYNSKDAKSLLNAVKLYLNGDEESAKKCADGLNEAALPEEYKEIYATLIEKLK